LAAERLLAQRTRELATAEERLARHNRSLSRALLQIAPLSARPPPPAPPVLPRPPSGGGVSGRSDLVISSPKDRRGARPADAEAQPPLSPAQVTGAPQAGAATAQPSRAYVTAAPGEEDTHPQPPEGQQTALPVFTHRRPGGAKPAPPSDDITHWPALDA